MKKITRLMALLLALLMVFALGACKGNEGGGTSSGGGGGTSSGGGNNSQEEIEYFDMKGATIKIACWWKPLPTADASTEEGRLHYYQLEEVKKNYNVQFEEIIVQQPDMRTNFDAALMSGDVWADIMYFRAEQADKYAKAGNLYDMTGLFDFDSVEYNQSIRERFTLDGKTYAFTYYVDNFDAAITFNKALFDRAGLEYPYQLVHDRKWTWDKFVEYVQKATIKDSDGKIDVYGWYAENGDYAADAFMWNAIGRQLIEVDENGNYYSNATDPEVQQFYNKIRELNAMEGVYMPPKDASWNDDAEKFRAGRIAMKWFSMSGGPSGLKDMVDDWGVVPIPTLNEGQDYKFLNSTQNVQIMPASLDAEWAKQVAHVYEEIYKSPYATDEEREAAIIAGFGTELRDKESVDIVYEMTYGDSHKTSLHNATMMGTDGYWSTVSVPVIAALRGEDTVAHAFGSFADAIKTLCDEANGAKK